MNKIFMMVGIQGSGKSTLSKLISDKYNIPIISSDSIRNELPNLPEEEVFPLVYKRLADSLKKGNNAIYDATSITIGARLNFFNKISDNGISKNEFECICVYFIPNPELSKERVSIRNNDKSERYLPLEVIDQYASKIEEPTLAEGYSQIIKINSDDNLINIVRKMD